MARNKVVFAGETLIDLSGDSVTARMLGRGVSAHGHDGEILIGTGDIIQFQVLGGTSQPASPSDNTVWVNTTDVITSWALSPAEPSAPSEGMVWIVLWGSDGRGVEGRIQMNLLSENLLNVYPLRAKQYISGEWVEKTAKSFQNGEWADWIVTLYLHNNGDKCENVTGGWAARAIPFQSGVNGLSPKITHNADNMHLSYNAYWNGGIVVPNKKVDLTDYRKIVFKGSVGLTSNQGARNCGFSAWSAIGSDQTINRLASLEIPYTQGGDMEHTLDISAITGECYIGFFLNAHANCSYTMIVREFYLE